MSSFTIDFFDLMFLAEACLPPKPIARFYTWYQICDVHYHKMSDQEKTDAFKWLKNKLDLNNEDHRYFYARFNPDNQYTVLVEFEGSKTEINCFRFNDHFYTSKNKRINENLIIKTERA